MKQFSLLLFTTLLTVMFLGTISAPVTAHRTGGEIRTSAACNKLKKPGLKSGCKRCLKKRGYHYHPRRKPGKRCHKNGSKK